MSFDNLLVVAAVAATVPLLLFLAGLEIDIHQFRGPQARRALDGLLVTVVLGIAVGYGLQGVGLAKNPLLVGIALMATSLGLVVPILKDAGVAERRVGQLTIAGASAGEVTFAVLLLVGLATVAAKLGFEAILGAFIAGALLRLVDADAEHTHPQFRVKLEGIGFGFLIPVFFVTSGLTFDLNQLTDHPATLLRVPLYLALLLVVRGLPALLYRSSLTGREAVAAGLLQASSLPFIVAATQIGLAVGAVTPANAAALVAAGLVSVLVYPVVALQLLPKTPDAAPMRALAREAM